MKASLLQKLVIGFPVISNRYLPDSAGQYKFNRSSNQSKASSVLGRMNKLGNKFAHEVREHVKGKLRLGARILQVGGVEKIFQQLFNVKEGEKLLKASQCYLSTTSGPIAGLLFISTEKIAFCSDRSIKITSPEGDAIRVHYKVSIPFSKIKSVNQSKNVKKPSQKYLEIITLDDFDFWFMGFLNYQKTFKYIQHVLSQQS